MPPPVLAQMPLQVAADMQTAARPITGRRYDRAAAVAYAAYYWNRHCSDGYVAVKKKGTPPYREVEPGKPFLNAGDDRDEAAEHAVEGRIPWSDLDDCAHFVSCCIGRPYDAAKVRPLLVANPGLRPADAPRSQAGGLNVRSVEGLGTPWVYGIVGAPTLVAFLSRPGIGVVTARLQPALDPALETAVRQLQPGDVIAMANERKSYTHVMFYSGDGKIACHTKCRRDARWQINNLAYYTCIHILDEILGP